MEKHKCTTKIKYSFALPSNKKVIKGEIRKDKYINCDLSTTKNYNKIIFMIEFHSGYPVGDLLDFSAVNRCKFSIQAGVIKTTH